MLGEWKDGKYHGGQKEGRYEGERKEGKKHGKGKWWSPSCAFYDGLTIKRRV